MAIKRSSRKVPLYSVLCWSHCASLAQLPWTRLAFVVAVDTPDVKDESKEGRAEDRTRAAMPLTAFRIRPHLLDYIPPVRVGSTGEDQEE